MAKFGCILSDDSVDALARVFMQCGRLGQLISPTDLHLIPAARELGEKLKTYKQSLLRDAERFAWIEEEIYTDEEASPNVYGTGNG